MAVYPLLCTGSLLIQTSTYSGIATTTSLPNLVSLTPSPIGPKQCAAILSCSNKKKNISGRLSLNVNIPSGLWTKWRKGLTSPPVGPIDGVTNQGTNSTPAATREVKSKGHIVIPYIQGLCESIKMICGRYGIQTHFKVGAPSRTSWSPERQSPHGLPKWCHILVSMWGPHMWWWIHRGKLQDLWWKIQRAPEGPLTYSSPQ